ncbi:MAG: SAM-dependent methyltransferase [Candidatus Scalindua rubra]|uniref:SAM-dependent methyltransferase n=1 Tax=Candidatus Scalindua rubra TaxID=1872076 RepID=A0A1E3XC78_9BACT|nr:MAG: SAM-dependent methyltransferase [Candidatus Scalindua rubra]
MEHDSKSYYQNYAAARKYDKTRFKTIRGRVFKILRTRIMNRFLSEFCLKGKAFDLACGTGLISEWLLKKKCKVVSGDFSFEMLSVLKEKFSGTNGSLNIVRTDALSLPFQAECFDLVTCFRFINLIPPESRMKVHKEVARVSRKYALLSYSAADRYQRLRRFLKGFLGYSSNGGFPATKEELSNELRIAGFEIVSTKMLLSLFTEELIVLVKKIT